MKRDYDFDNSLQWIQMDIGKYMCSFLDLQNTNQSLNKVAGCMGR